MAAITVLGTSRLGERPRCDACGAGATISFNWRHLKERRSEQDRKQIELFEAWRTLRRGSLYRCRVCEATWHLDGRESLMTHVGEDRLRLVLAWDVGPISLPAHLVAVIDEIGPTPPDVYGNGRERRVTPCAVQTLSGDLFESAMVCVQPDAPVEDWIQFRLGTEVADIRPSKHALPKDVRQASSSAHEVRMGFSPSLIEMPDKRRFVLNGMTSFMAVAGYDATSARSIKGSYFTQNPPPEFIDPPRDLVYFIVDGEPRWGTFE